MAIYRVLKPLSTGHQPGDLVDGNSFKSLDVLVAVKALAPVSTPPLSELPGWIKRAERLNAVGIITVQDLLDTKSSAIAEIFGYKSTAGIDRWKEEVREWLMPKPPEKKP